jgi:hypothetical protein
MDAGATVPPAVTVVAARLAEQGLAAWPGRQTQATPAAAPGLLAGAPAGELADEQAVAVSATATALQAAQARSRRRVPY